MKAKWKEFKIIFKSIVSGTFIFTLIGILGITILGLVLKYFDWLFSVLQLY